MFFRSGVSPEWEDPLHVSGGHFQFHWRPNSIKPGQLDEYWNNLVLSVIGNSIEAEGEFSNVPIVTGVRLVDKTGASGRAAGIRVEVWFSEPSELRHLQKVRTKIERTMSLKIDSSVGTVPRCETRYHSQNHL